MTEEIDVMECSAECNMACNMGVDNDDDIITEQFSGLLDSLVVAKAAISEMQKQVRILERNINRRQRKVDRERKKRKPRSKKLSGFAVPTQISDELCDFMKKEKNELVARTDVTRYIIKYVKDNDLQNKVNGQIINPNDELKKLLNVGEDDKLTYFNIQKFMNRHFHKASLTASASDSTTSSAPTLQID